MTIAEWMNQRPLIQKLRAGKQPIGKETIRDLLQNRVYTGRVPYSDTQYSGSLGQGRRSNRKQKQWFEGNHQGFITDELFEDCQAARQELSKVKHSPSTLRTYLLSDRVYCARCVGTKPPRLADTHYGKMRPGWDRRRNHARYRCLARDRGYHSCEQGYISTDWVDE